MEQNNIKMLVIVWLVAIYFAAVMKLEVYDFSGIRVVYMYIHVLW